MYGNVPIIHEHRVVQRRQEKNNQSDRNNLLRKDVRILVSVALSLMGIGLLFIYSASSAYAMERIGVPHYFLKRQAIFLLPSTIGFFICALIPLKWWRSCAGFFLSCSVMVGLFTLISSVGTRIHGSSRWIMVGSFGIQPSEFIKMFLLMYASLLLERKCRNQRAILWIYFPLCTAFFVGCFVLLKQPDFGSVVITLTTLTTLLFVAGFQVYELLIGIAFALPVGFFLIYSRAYRVQRILTFFNPWRDPLGKGFQIIQSLIAIGVGGMWGAGVAQSRQKFFYLPMQHSDFIFSIIAEETGFVGSCLLIMLYLVFCITGMRIASRLSSEFAVFVVFSFTTMISLQALLNLMVACGLVPTKGLGLPFVSYGGSALLASSCMLGCIVSAARSERFLRQKIDF